MTYVLSCTYIACGGAGCWRGMEHNHTVLLQCWSSTLLQSTAGGLRNTITQHYWSAGTLHNTNTTAGVFERCSTLSHHCWSAGTYNTVTPLLECWNVVQHCHTTPGVLERCTTLSHHCWSAGTLYNTATPLLECWQSHYTLNQHLYCPSLHLNALIHSQNVAHQ